MQGVVARVRYAKKGWLCSVWGMVAVDLRSNIYTCIAEEHAYCLPGDPSSLKDWKMREPLEYL